MMKACTGRKKYTGAFDENLSSVVEEYEMTARMCGWKPRWDLNYVGGLSPGILRSSFERIAYL
jgi:hypothetical protein